MIILIDTPDYPDGIKTKYSFVKQLVLEFSRQGNQCLVLAPQSVTKEKKFYPFLTREEYGICVYRPNYISLSNFKLGKTRLSDYFRRKALYKAFKRLEVKPDIVYCHFWKSVIEAYPYAKANNIPLFVASGESSIADFKSEAISSEIREYVKGVVCASTKNKEESVSLGLTTPEKCLVKPNAVDNTIFQELDKSECRKKLGLPAEAFIIIFVGAFISRKGTNRVSKAIERIGGKPVYSIFVGKGDEDPNCKNILFKGGLAHNLIPLYLNASDVFVLPTKAEGCCNAIVEAMSCGLPIISSNLPFNWDILDESNAIMIDPNNVEQLSNAIAFLRDNVNVREQMGHSSLQKAKALTIEQRASDILNFIKAKIQNRTI